MTVDAVFAHIWQSTVVAAVIALVALAFRRVPAEMRYWIWFAGSLKFMIPFGALAALGARLEWRDALASTPPEWTLAIEGLTQPFLAPLLPITLPRAEVDTSLQFATISAGIWLLGCAAVLGVWLVRWRRVSRTVRTGGTVLSGRVFDALRRLEPSTTLPIVSSDASVEPGVFGLVRPVLLWPRDIDTRLDDAQVDAILAHELVHVRRGDNLTAAVHMAVEALFWFHPMVWWIGSRLVDERERACDEEVVRLGNEPHVYAESILKTCQFHIESPLSCVSGVTGSNLTRRIERIMADRPRPGVRAWPGTLLLMAASMALVAPVVVGALGAPAFPAAIDSSAHERPSFDEATVSPNATGGNLRRVSMLILPDGTWEATNVTLESMIRMSYRLQESQLIGGPAWMYTDRFDIRAKSDASGSVADVPLRVQSLLAERFNLRVHDETRDLPIYSLVIDRNDLRSGPRLMRAAVDCAGISRTRREMAPIEPRRPDGRPTCGTIIGMGRLSGGGVTMPQIAQALSQYTGRTVIDRSGLSGTFDYDLEFTPNPAVRGSGSNAGNSIFTAVREQLGLRLDAQRGPVSVVVIDSVQQPVKN